jgi:type III secretory pathway component EscU
MQEPIYRRALKRAFQLVLHHKILWIFGVLSLLLGQLGWNNFIGALLSTEETGFSTYFFTFPWGSVWSGGNILWSLWLAILILVISILVLVVAVVSEGALIAASAMWFKGAKIVHIDEAWRKGVKHFGRLLTVHLGKKFLMVLLLVSVNNLIYNVGSVGGFGGNFLIAAIAAVGIFLALVVSTVGIFASGYIVEHELKIVDAVKRAYNLFADHVLVSLELSLLLLVVQMGVVLIFMAASTWFLLPFATFSVIGGITGSTAVIMTGLLSSVALFFLVAALIGGILNAFGTAAWIYLFLKMDHEGVGSKILSWLRFKKA